MPRMNARGQCCLGVGSGPLSVDGRVLADVGGCAQWLADDRVIYNGAHGLEVQTPTTSQVELIDGRGANEIASGGGRWAAWLAGTGVYGAFGAVPVAGLNLVGNDGRGAAGPDGTLATVTIRADGQPTWLMRPDGSRSVLSGVVRDLQILGPQQAVWRDDAGAIRVFGLPQPRQAGPAFTPRWVAIPGEAPWILYWTERIGTVAHPINSLIGVVLSRADAFYPDARWIDGRLRVVWSRRAGELPDDLVVIEDALILPREELSIPPIIIPAAPGPRSAPRVDDGTEFDLLSFILGEPGAWPRKGPTHPMHQHVVGQLWHYVKFGDIAPDGAAYETWAHDADWIYHLEDQSGSDVGPYSFSDPRWFPRRMRIGYAHRFVTGEHRKLARSQDGTCRVLTDQPFSREMWVEAVYDRYWWGTDLGERETVVLAYDPTGGAHIPERGVELGFFARGAGSVRWEYHWSNRVYASGPPLFSNATRKDRSDFYLLGGPAPTPKLTGCVKQEVPVYVPPEDDPMPTSQRVALVGPAGKYARVDPASRGSGLFGGCVVVFDRDVPGEHETFELTKPDGKFQIRALAADVILGADATRFSADLCSQYYTSGGEVAARGAHESWTVVRLPSDLVVALVEWDRYASATLGVVPL